MDAANLDQPAQAQVPLSTALALILLSKEQFAQCQEKVGKPGSQTDKLLSYMPESLVID